MAIAEIAHTQVAGVNGGTTPAINTTGVNLITAVVTSPYLTSPTLSDSLGNTYIVRESDNDPGPNVLTALYECLNPTVGASHTFTISRASSISSLFVEAFSGVAAADTSVGFGQASGSTIQPGSITPTPDNGTGLFVTGCQGSASAPTIDSSFIANETTAVSGGVHYAGGIAYKIATGAGAENPTWTGPTLMDIAVMATYTAAAAATSNDDERHYPRGIHRGILRGCA